MNISVASCVCSKCFFNGFYHAKSLLNHHLWNIIYLTAHWGVNAQLLYRRLVCLGAHGNSGCICCKPTFCPGEKRKHIFNPQNRVIPKIHGIFWYIWLIVDGQLVGKHTMDPMDPVGSMVFLFSQNCLVFMEMQSKKARKRWTNHVSGDVEKVSKKKHNRGWCWCRRSNSPEMMDFFQVFEGGWNIMISHRFTDMMLDIFMEVVSQVKLRAMLISWNPEQPDFI